MKEMRGSSSSSDRESLAYELDDLSPDAAILAAEPTQRPRWWYGLSRGQQPHRRGGNTFAFLGLHTPHRRRSLRRRVLQFLKYIPYALAITVVACALVFPSYTHPPRRYDELRNRAHSSGIRPNANDEKVFIAASLYDHKGELVSGDWGRAVIDLVDILGHDNVFLSIYEDNPDDLAQKALDDFTGQLQCKSAIVSEKLNLGDYPHVVTAEGRHLLKRIAFLADVRNRALRPLENTDSSAYYTRFDKLLYLNDVVFDPVDAANLLLSTNVDESSGRTDYRAACAVDFINPFKFYDTFATRDLEGYDMGVPFYPWFTNAGRAESRRDVLAQKDAVRVKSCWGGMVAFEAKWFQKHLHTDTTPSLRFRSETDTYWDASECCLIHADLVSMNSAKKTEDIGIYVNPYIRVAYSTSVLRWLSFTRRFERLYTPIHRIINWIGSRPSSNPRQFHEPRAEVTDRVWMWDNETADISPNELDNPEHQPHGQFKDIRRTALPGGFCGMRNLLYINEHPSPGESKWGFAKLPPGST